MKNLLYIGNKLSIHGNTATSIETLGSYLEMEGYNLTYASSKKNKITRIFDMIWTTIRNSTKTDFVLIDIYSTQNFWYAIIISQLCRLLNLKYITQLHGGNLPHRLRKNSYLCNLLFANAFRITAPSDYLLNAFSKNFSANLIYIPNAIEIKHYEYQNREISNPKILWVRSFAAIYNPMMAIKMMEVLKDKYPLAELCMVGPDKENLINECKKYAGEKNLNVIFTGKLEKMQWLTLSKNFNIFINTTHLDNMPVSVIEAMALGLPVISTNVGGIPFAIKNKINGLLVDDNDYFAMAKEIQYLTENPQIRSNIVTLARLKVEDFDWHHVRKKWFEILE